MGKEPIVDQICWDQWELLLSQVFYPDDALKVLLFSVGLRVNDHGSFGDSCDFSAGILLTTAIYLQLATQQYIG